MENLLVTEKSFNYELLDSGEGEKLERYGKVILSRPDPQALWSKSLPLSEWQKADAVFKRNSTSGKWDIRNEMPKGWGISLEGLIFNLGLMPSKHLGVFPEQSVQWRWLSEKIKKKIKND